MASYGAVPHRKPVGAAAGIPAALRPVQPDLAQQQLRQPAHAHARTASSNIFPGDGGLTMSPTTAAYPPQAYPPAVGYSRRTASTATASTTSSQGGNVPGRQPSTVSVSLWRTNSSRSGQSVNPGSYVALMRKQKATVWCDRAQHEDPRAAAQLKAAKQRAALEVTGTGRPIPASSNTSGGGVRSKIRHHGAPKAVGYSPASLLVGTQGVPARLSASEVGDEDKSDDDGDSGRYAPGARNGNGSGRSSLVGNPNRLTAYGNRPPGRLSTSSTPPSNQGSSPAEPTDTKTPMQGAPQPAEYFASDRASSKASGSSGEERRFGNAAAMEAPAAQPREGRTAEDLTRRGSVDERAMTMRGPRLYIANPDADSD